jgi:hypothetical protein
MQNLFESLMQKFIRLCAVKCTSICDLLWQKEAEVADREKGEKGDFCLVIV